jgi:hypothetical protein
MRIIRNTFQGTESVTIFQSICKLFTFKKPYVLLVYAQKQDFTLRNLVPFLYSQATYRSNLIIPYYLPVTFAPDLLS